jgi:hypothetical protein
MLENIAMIVLLIGIGVIITICLLVVLIAVSYRE